MGQRHSTVILRPKLSFVWVLRRGRRQRAFPDNPGTNCKGANGKRSDSKKGQTVVNKEEAGTKKRAEGNIRTCTDRFHRHEVRVVREFRRRPAARTNFPVNSHDNFYSDRPKSATRQSHPVACHGETMKRALSEPSLERRADRGDYCHRRGRCLSKPLVNGNAGCNSGSSGSSKSDSHESGANTFGYAIADLDAILVQASIEKPANIPVVLSFPSVLYQTQGGIQNEMSLPLGTVANAIFKNQAWLYVQTPHGHEGYVGCTSCLPLGILPQSERRAPCWEDPTDVFPRPLGNTGNAATVRDKSSECRYHRRSTAPVRVSISKVRYIARVNARVDAGGVPAYTTLPGNITRERNVDRLYLEAIAAEHYPHVAPSDFRRIL